MNIPKFFLMLCVFALCFIGCNDDELDVNVNFVASVGYPGINSLIRYSENGIDWPVNDTTLLSQTYLINGLAYGDNHFIGVGNGIYTYQSEDGINWNLTYLDSIETYNDIVLGEYHNQSPWMPYFVAVGNEGVVMYTSTHGKFWSTGASGVSRDLNSMAFGLTTTGLSMFVAVGDAPALSPVNVPNHGTLIYSITAGDSWIQHSLGGTTRDLYCVAFGGGKFIAAGADGVMLYSANGSVWEFMDSNSFEDINGICYGVANNSPIWVAVGVYGTLLYSQDSGTTWNSGSYTSTNTSWKSVICSNNKFYAVGYGGSVGGIIYSNDGINWQNAANFTNNNYFRDIASKNP